MRRVIFFLILAVIILPTLAHAQTAVDKTIWHLLPERQGLVSVSYLYDTRAAVENNPGTLSYNDVRVNGMFPIPLGESFVLAPGIRFNWHNFRLHDITNYLNQNTVNLYNIGVSLDGFITFGDRWILDLNVSPMIASDLKSMGRRDWQFVGYALAGWAFSDSASLLFGVAATKEFWRYLPVPLVGFVVRPEDSFFSFETVLPQYIRADFRVAKFLKLFAQGEFEGFVWDIKGSGNVPDHFGKLIDTRAGAGLRFLVTRGFEIETWGGVNPYRKLHFANNAANEITERIRTGFFAQASLIITPEMFSR